MKATAIALALSILCALGCGKAEPPVEDQQGVELENGSFTTTRDGRTIHYEVHGAGPVLMALTNSWGLSLEGLRGLFSPLESRTTMVYFDPRGMGGSSAVVEPSDMSLAAVREDFHTVRRHLGLESVNAIGWSNGATNLILLASEHPETIDKAVFVHGIADFGPEDMMAFAQKYPELAQQYVAFQQEMADETLSDSDRDARMREMWLGSYFPAITADPASAGPAIRSAFAGAEFSWAHAQYATSEAPTLDLRDRLGAITASCLVIAGSHDSIPVEKVKTISDGASDAVFEIFEASGHFAPIEEPDRFTTTVFRFLGAADTESGDG